MNQISNNLLEDSYGRVMRKLRVSLLDRCQMRCQYCMPANPQFLKNSELLSVEELIEIVSDLVEMGIEELRLTGGEPTLHPQFTKIIQGLSSLPVQKISLTTNAMTLHRHFDDLLAAGIRHLNISIDSLSPQQFAKLTKQDCLNQVIRNIDAAVSKGFIVKTNTVILKNTNESEIPYFIQFAQKHKVVTRFLELIKIGVAAGEFHKQFVSADSIEKIIRQDYQLQKIKAPLDSTAEKFLVDNNTEIGIIASETRAFCQQCSRLRLTQQGELRACLMKAHGVHLRGISSQERQKLAQALIPLKPINRVEKFLGNMYQIGG